jgi:CRISPR system Cascade subunit CasB
MMKTQSYLTFKDPKVMTILTSWWKSLDDARGDRAALRRCHSILEVAFIPAYHRLRMDLEQFGHVDPDRLALVVGVLSHLKENTRETSTATFAQQLATPKKDGDRAVMSGLRFRRLLQVENPDDLYPTMIRAVRLLGGAADINTLVNGVYWWNEMTKKSWAFEYYGKALNED